MRNKIIVLAITFSILTALVVVTKSKSDRKDALPNIHYEDKTNVAVVDQSAINQKDRIADPDGGNETPETMQKEKDQYIKQQGTPNNAAATIENHGSYKDYSSEIVQAEQKKGNKVVLFFHAPWCPYCRAADEAFITKTDQIPIGVTVLKTDYDSNTDLKQKYGVTYQHTFVQIDSNEKLVTKWNGGDIDNLKKYLK